VEQADTSYCAENIVTDPKSLTGVSVQLNDVANPCTAARKVTTAIINRIRTNPPKRANLSGSLAMIDPCTTVDDTTAASAVSGTAQKSQPGFYECDWENGVRQLSVAFSIGSDPKDGAEGQVDLGGVTGYQQNTAGGCEIKWVTRSSGSDEFDSEIVDVTFKYLTQAQGDTCPRTLAAAKVVATKVPKPS
jgi:hypothetical protein